MLVLVVIYQKYLRKNIKHCTRQYPLVHKRWIAVTKLNRGKRDGSENFYSDHIINASPKLYAMLAMLINCMVAHGYSPHKLLKSTIVPIPKDNRSSMTRSENYRAIALCNSICNLIDIVFIDKYSDALYVTLSCQSTRPGLKAITFIYKGWACVLPYDSCNENQMLI